MYTMWIACIALIGLLEEAVIVMDVCAMQIMRIV